MTALLSRLTTRRLNILLSAIIVAAGLALPAIVHAGEDTSSAEAAYADMKATFGAVPSFVAKFPKAGIAGAWSEVKNIELSDKTALPPKVKSLISLAVAAQIPCQYCIYADTMNAKAAGATDEEIQEAVAMAALTRHWSTVFYGNQIDFDQFKREMAGN